MKRRTLTARTSRPAGVYPRGYQRGLSIHPTYRPPCAAGSPRNPSDRRPVARVSAPYGCGGGGTLTQAATLTGCGNLPGEEPPLRIRQRVLQGLRSGRRRTLPRTPTPQSRRVAVPVQSPPRTCSAETYAPRRGLTTRDGPDLRPRWRSACTADGRSAQQLSYRRPRRPVINTMNSGTSRWRGQSISVISGSAVNSSSESTWPVSA